MHALPLISAAVLSLTLAAPAKAAVIQATDDQGACASSFATVLPELRTDGSSVMRFIVDPRYVGLGVTCVTQAEDAGYSVYLSIQYDNTLTPVQAAAYFTRTLALYDPNGRVWAISVGNEQTLQAAAPSPQQYRDTWDAVEPILPVNAIHVFADASPWDETQIAESWATYGTSPRGVDVIAEHAYDVAGGAGLRSVPEWSAWAAQRGVQFWLSETSPQLDDPRELAAVLAFSPNVTLVCDYVWHIDPASFPGWGSPPPSAAAVAAFVASVTAQGNSPVAATRQAPSVLRDTQRRARRVLFAAHFAVGRVHVKRSRRARHVYHVYRQSAGNRVNLWLR